MSERLERTTPDVSFAADVLRAPEAVPAEVRARLQARLAATLALPTSGASTSGASTSALPTATPPPPSTEPVSTAARVMRSGALLATGLVIGIAIGRLTAPSASPTREPAPSAPPPSPIVERPAEPVIEAAPSEPRIEEPAAVAVVVEPARPRARAARREEHAVEDRASPIAAAATSDDTESEDALLEEARQALRSGDPSHALTLLSAHESSFAQGSLIEEREALAVRALLAAHRDDEARERAERFVTHYPRSIFSSVVRPALGR